jgi:hypothetical protein
MQCTLSSKIIFLISFFFKLRAVLPIPGFGTWVARLSLVQNTKMKKNIPNDHKIFPMAVK